jgi:glycosyltransferase involved in cell wall biosynthesis
MDRAAILPTPGDPFINGLWLSSFRLWKNEVDKLYVCVNSGLDDEVLEYTKEIYEREGAEVLLQSSFAGHGVAINKCLDACREKNILLLEDDFYILQRNQVDRLFNIIENGEVDAVVSSRGSCSAGLHTKINEVFGLTGQVSLVPNFWPCLYLSDKKHLIETDRWLDSVNFYNGDRVDDLDWTVNCDEHGDTFVGTSIQLRSKGLRFHYEEQYRNTTDDLHLFPEGKGMFSAPLPWTHFGSTSSGINGALMDENMKLLGSRNTGYRYSLPTIVDEHIGEDHERRIALWELCWQYFPVEEGSPANYFNKVYGDAISRLIDGCKLSRDKINAFKSIYNQVLYPILPQE